MDNLVQLVGPQRAVEIFGIRLVGVNAENGTKLLMTLAFLACLWVVSACAVRLARVLFARSVRGRTAFWTRQIIMLATAILGTIGFVSIWFDDPKRLTAGLGLVTAGLAFALQKVVTAVAGYFIILRGKTFDVGDRIVMGGVRGDVIALGFTQTTIMEMGQPPPVQSAAPAMWVQSRQYTGRVVTVSNAKIFDEPVYNYSREFPYIWEEISVPIAYRDRERAEQILLEAARVHTLPISTLSTETLQELRRRYAVKESALEPRVFYRLTDNWLELTVRFIAEEHGVRALKDAVSRQLLRNFEEAGIGIASATLELVGVPPLRLEQLDRHGSGNVLQPRPHA